jgi:ABC-2 type transport system permease protein
VNALIVARRDLGAYFHGLTGYIIIAAVLFVTGGLFQVRALGSGAHYSHEVLENFFENIAGTTMIAGVLLTMRSIAEERQTGTDTILHTAPIREWEIVLGKYLAAMGMITALTVLTLYMPALIMVNGKISYEHVLVGYIGVLGLGSTAVSIGIFGSSLFRTQLPAGIVAGVITASFVICWLLSDFVNAPFTDIVAYMALFDKHFQPFEKGKLMTSGLVFYASLSWGFLMLSTRVLEGRRWQ